MAENASPLPPSPLELEARTSRGGTKAKEGGGIDLDGTGKSPNRVS